MKNIEESIATYGISLNLQIFKLWKSPQQKQKYLKNNVQKMYHKALQIFRGIMTFNLSIQDHWQYLFLYDLKNTRDKSKNRHIDEPKYQTSV